MPGAFLFRYPSGYFWPPGWLPAEPVICVCACVPQKKEKEQRRRAAEVSCSRQGSRGAPQTPHRVPQPVVGRNREGGQRHPGAPLRRPALTCHRGGLAQHQPPTLPLQREAKRTGLGRAGGGESGLAPPPAGRGGRRSGPPVPKGRRERGTFFPSLNLT